MTVTLRQNDENLFSYFSRRFSAVLLHIIYAGLIILSRILKGYIQGTSTNKETLKDSLKALEEHLEPSMDKGLHLHMDYLAKLDAY
jgi:hypothetical protein